MYISKFATWNADAQYLFKKFKKQFRFEETSSFGSFGTFQRSTDNSCKTAKRLHKHKNNFFLHKFCLRTYFHQPINHYVLLTFTPLMLVVLGGTSWSFWKRGSGPNNLIMTVSVSVFLKKFCITTRKCVTNILQLL